MDRQSHPEGEVTRAEYEELRGEVQEVLRLIAGDPFDTARPSVFSRLQTIEEAMWGPKGRPNGMVGSIKEMRLTTRTTAAGVFITVGGAVVLRLLGVGG